MTVIETETEEVPNTEDLIFVCPECGEEKKDKRTLGLHRRNHHGVVSEKAKRASSSTKRKSERKPREFSEEFLIATVLKALYPDGMMPIKDFPHVAVWLKSSFAFFEKVKKNSN